MKGFKKAQNEDEKGDKAEEEETEAQAQARVDHKDETNTYDVQAERKPEEQEERK